MKNHRTYMIVIILLFAATIFVVDMQTPHGVAEWVLYLPLPLLATRSNRSGQVLGISCICTVLLVIGFFLSPTGIAYEWAVGNRVMALLGLWLMTFACLAMIRHSILMNQLTESLQDEVTSRVLTEQSLRKSEERWRLAMQGGGLGTRDVNLQTDQEIWSETQFQILGYEPIADGKATGEMWMSRVHPDDRIRLLDAKDQARRNHSLYHLEYRICRPNQPRAAWVEVYGRYHYDENGEAIRFVGVCFDISTRRDLEREVVEVTAKQQQDIGQELHDGVGQELTGLGLMAQTLTQRLSEHSPERGIAARLVGGLNRVHQQVRELSRGIMPVQLDASGLSAALAELAARLAEETGVAVTSESPESIELPDNSTATQIFRIAQEAVANAIRHGKPRTIGISLFGDERTLHMRIRDDGIGVGDGAARASGLGLRIMTYRAGQIGGTISIVSPSEGGTVVALEMPWSNRRGEEKGV